MKKNNKNIIIGAASLIVILVAAVIFVNMIPCSTSVTGFAIVACEAPSDGNTNANYEEALAKCLTDKGVKMYGASWCGHCKNQKAMFGNAFQYVDYIECTEDQAACDMAGVRGYPTWIGANGAKYPGEKELKDLAETFGC